MTEKTTLEDVIISGVDGLTYSNSDPNSEQLNYITYELPSGVRLLTDADVFNGQYIIHSDESDILTSIPVVYDDVEISQSNISVEESESVKEENVNCVRIADAFNLGSVVDEKLASNMRTGVQYVKAVFLPGTQVTTGLLSAGALPMISAEPQLSASTVPHSSALPVTYTLPSGVDALGLKLSPDVQTFGSLSVNGAFSTSLEMVEQSADNVMISNAGDDNITEKEQSIFTTIQATLSSAFLSSLDEILGNALKKMTDDHNLQIVHNPATDSSYVIGSCLSDFVRLENFLSELIDSISPKVSSKSTDARIETSDKATTCLLLQPQFSRAGREIRCKDHSTYEDAFDVVVPKLGETIFKHEKVTDFSDGKLKRKRGRPRKIPPQGLSCSPRNVEEIDSSRVSISDFVGESETNGCIDVSVQSDDATGQKTKEKLIHWSGIPISSGISLYSASDDKTDDIQMDASTIDIPVEDDNYEFDGTTNGFQRLWLKSKDYENRAPFRHCPVCSFRTKRESHLQKHIQLHDRNIPILKCTHCSYCTTRQNHLTRHEMQHKSTVYRCDRPGCKYQTDNQRLLTRHSALRHSVSDNNQDLLQPVLECPMANCAYRTHRAYLIQRHLVRHSAVDGDDALVERYSCNACSYETERREHYLRHLNAVHSDARPYLCDNCGRSFKRKDSLAQHSVIHQEKTSRPYQYECIICHTKFRSLGHLNDHQAKHKSDRSYLCEICGSSFKTKAVQRKHILSIHSNPRSFVCSICSKCFNTSYALKRHALSHGTKTECPI